jgi:Cof subfamily protein (haloacid dehalogenase superfamily)
MHYLSEISDHELAEHLAQRDIRLVCFDIDGTLLGASGAPSVAVKNEIARIQQRGIKTCIASGRPWFSSRWLAEELKLFSPGVFNTGAAIVDPLTQTVLHSEPVAPVDVLALLAAAKNLDVYAEIYTPHYYVTEQEHPLQIIHQQYMKQSARYEVFADVVMSESIHKVLLCVDEQRDGERIYQLAKQFPQLHFGYGHGAAHPHLLFASVVSEAACKQKAFNWLLDYHGINADQVMSFGDGGSDIAFLQQAGIGVAMGNAKDEVKAAANFVTRDVERDGIAYALTRLIS